MKNIYSLLLLLIALSGCSPYMVTIIDNNIQFKQAVSPFNSNVVDVAGQCYQDEYITMEFHRVEKNAIFLTLANNHDSTIRILWDESAFVDYNGYSHRINHDGSEVNKLLLNGASATTSYVSTTSGDYSRERSYGAIGTEGVIVDTEKVQIPDVIPSKSRINTVVTPVGVAQIIRYENVDKISYKDDLNSNKGLEAFDNYKSKTELTAVRLLLPIEVDGKKLEYTFIFKDEFQMHTERYDGADNTVIFLVPSAVLVFVLGCVI